MKIKETIERNCCHPQKDLKQYKGEITQGDRKRELEKYKFCVYCGQLWENVRESDGIGNMENILIKIAI